MSATGTPKRAGSSASSQPGDPDVAVARATDRVKHTKAKLDRMKQNQPPGTQVAADASQRARSAAKADRFVKALSGSVDTKLRKVCEMDTGEDWMVKKLLSQNADPNRANRGGMTPLHLVARTDSVAMAEILLANGAKLTKKDAEGMTPLHIAALTGSCGVARMLAKAGASANIPDRDGQTAIHCAVQADSPASLETLAVLLKDCAAPAVNLRDDRSMTALLHACTRGREDHVRLLLKCGADATIANDDQLSSLHIAVANADMRLMMSLAKRAPAVLTLKDSFGRTGLHLATLDGNEPLVDLLITLGADTEAADDTGRTALHWGAHEGKMGAVAALLERKADMNAADEYGALPIHYAVQQGRDAAVKLLIASGASVSTGDSAGRQPLIWGVLHDAKRCCRMLIDGMAPINGADNQQFTALHYAAHQGKIFTSQFLIHYGADLDIVDAKKHTPLFRATIEGKDECAKLLLAAGANEGAQDVDGRTCLHWAAAAGAAEAVANLLDNNAAPDVADNGGLHPLHDAASGGHVGIAAALIDCGAPVEAVTAGGVRPLHLAALAGSLDMVKLLLKHGSEAQINAPDHAAAEPKTALDYALLGARNDDLSVAKHLKLHGAKIWSGMSEREKKIFAAKANGTFIADVPEPTADEIPLEEQTGADDAAVDPAAPGAEAEEPLALAKLQQPVAESPAPAAAPAPADQPAEKPPMAAAAEGAAATPAAEKAQPEAVVRDPHPDPEAKADPEPVVQEPAPERPAEDRNSASIDDAEKAHAIPTPSLAVGASAGGGEHPSSGSAAASGTGGPKLEPAEPEKLPAFVAPQGRPRGMALMTVAAPTTGPLSPHKPLDPIKAQTLRREQGWDDDNTAKAVKPLLERKPIPALAGNQQERLATNADAEFPGLLEPLISDRGSPTRGSPTKRGDGALESALRVVLRQREKEIEVLKMKNNKLAKSRRAQALDGITTRCSAIRETLTTGLAATQGKGADTAANKTALRKQVETALSLVVQLRADAQKIQKAMVK